VRRSVRPLHCNALQGFLCGRRNATVCEHFERLPNWRCRAHFKRRDLQEDEAALRSEAKVLMELSHPNIVELVGWYEEQDVFYVPLGMCCTLQHSTS
jgi:hypothetical protein